MSKPNYPYLYEKEYFRDRGNDAARDEMYRQEISRLKKYIPKKGKILDIGCGRGEFLTLFNNKWKKYGTEISKYATLKAKERGVNFRVPKTKRFFDLIVFRGTIQHLNNPIYEIEHRIEQLKPGGHMVFLATPNAGGIYYRLFQDLPMLAPEKNFFIPSDKVLCQILINFGLKIKKVYYPYKETPYSNFPNDYFLFILRIFKIVNKRHAFPKNTMEIFAQKPK